MPVERRISRRTRAAVGGLTLTTVAVAVAFTLPSSASADPSANDWYRLRMCESSNNYSIDTGNGYYGAYQFNLATWRGVGGSGLPSQASPGEQDARALRLYRERGWQPWTCASIVGLREDSDARSGRVGDITIPRAGSPAAPTTATAPAPRPTAPASSSAPAWPGPRYFSIGDSHATIARFQAQLHRRGWALVGDGLFGPKTQAEVKRIQGQNGLPQTGLLGPVTWKLAWTGAYHPTRPAGPAKATVKKPVVKKPVVKKPVVKKPVAKPVVKKPVTKPAVKKPVVKKAAPAWPGPRYFSIGDRNHTVAVFQAQLHRRGSFLIGDGIFGPNTRAAVKHLQALNGLPQTGLLGPVTWKLAWTGRWSNIRPL